ncbi:MAG: hypothetical protein JWO57_437, partial [Pseudonocardiales bacterium]|nr:hypothetical protein [Pseudonocardiales bacterium]
MPELHGPRREIVGLVTRPSQEALTALAAPDARLCLDMRLSSLSDGSTELLGVLGSLDVAQRAGLTALGHADRTVLIAPARHDRPATRTLFVFSHPAAGRVTEIVTYTDEDAAEALVSTTQPTA